tara:strand:- start:2471 stop:3133 length:663 start_codon:yes stop_codon:yes gene_type:complete
MVASLPADQEIDQAIKRLQRKMQAVSDNLDRGRNYKKSSRKRVKGKSRQGINRSSLSRPLKYLFIFMLLGATSFVVAQIAKGYMKNLENVDSTETAETEKNEPSNEVHSQQPIADISQATDKAPPLAPAKFSMQAANYNIVESELGPVLDIAITVANIGEEPGRPKLFEIELVDDANKQLMKWPMAASGASISPQQEMVYKTRLIEPPADFKNIRVTMKK